MINYDVISSKAEIWFRAYLASLEGQRANEALVRNALASGEVVAGNAHNDANYALKLYELVCAQLEENASGSK